MAASAKKELRAQLQTIRALIEKINLRDRKHAAAYLAIDKKFEQFGKVSHEFFYPLPLPNYNDAKTQELQQLLNKPFSSEDELITKLSLLIHEGADINQTFNNFKSRRSHRLFFI
jgi:superoxide dismutase